jgi:hypothetical protein
VRFPGVFLPMLYFVRETYAESHGVYSLSIFYLFLIDFLEPDAQFCLSLLDPFLLLLVSTLYNSESKLDIFCKLFVKAAPNIFKLALLYIIYLVND